MLLCEHAAVSSTSQTNPRALNEHSYGLTLLPTIRSEEHLLLVYLLFSCSWTPWAIARQAPLSMRFSSGLSFPSPGAFPSPGIEPASPALAGGFVTTEPRGSPFVHLDVLNYFDTLEL